MTQLNDPMYDGAAQDVPLDSFDRSESVRTLLYGRNTARPGYASALSIEQIVGNGGGTGPGLAGSAPAPVQIYPYETLAVDGTQKALTAVPTDATYAEIEVVVGAVNWAMGGAPGGTTRLLELHDGLRLRGAEIAAFRATQSGIAAATLHVEYGREA